MSGERGQNVHIIINNLSVRSCRTGVEVKLWRAIRNHRKTYPNSTTERQQHAVSMDELNRNDQINTNIHSSSSAVQCSDRPISASGGSGAHNVRNLSHLINNNIVPEITVRMVTSQPGSNSNSFDSGATTSSYESCNGGAVEDQMDV